MKLSVPCCNIAHQSKESTKEILNRLLNEVLEEKNLKGSHNPLWIDEKTLDTVTIPPLALHSFLLRVEQLGISFATERKVTVSFA